jgi:hypothetical protein
MTKIVLGDAVSGYNLAIINDNFERIQDELNNKVLYRDNPVGEPNQMLNTLDMNSNRIVNLPKPVGLSEPARLQDLVDVATTGQVPTSASQILVNPVGGIVSTDVQSALVELSTEASNEATNRASADSLLGSSIVPLAYPVNNIAELRTVSKTAHAYVVTRGYYAAGDKGGSRYYLDINDSTSADNGGSVIVASDGGRWKIADAYPWTLAQFGGKPDGITDNLSAFLALKNAAPDSARIHIKIGPGKWYFTNTITHNFGANNTIQSFKIEGSGSGITSLLFAASVIGIATNHNGSFHTVHYKGFDMLTTGQGPTTCYGMLLTQLSTSIPNPANTAPSYIEDIVFRGSDGFIVSNYWQQGVRINGMSNIYFTDCHFAGMYPNGDAVIMFSTTPAVIPCVFNFLNCSFVGWNTSINYGANVQGVSITMCNFTGNNYGVFAASGLVNLDQLSITGSQFNNAIASIGLNSPVGAFTCTNSFFLVQNNSNGIYINNAYDYSLFGNVFNPAALPATNQNGITIDTYLGAGGVITGNSFIQLTTAITLKAGSQRTNVQSNTYWNNTTTVSNLGTNNTVGGGSA